MVLDMEMTPQEIAKDVHFATRTAERLASLYRSAGLESRSITRSEEHELLEAIEVISKHTEIPGRVLWLQMVEGNPNAQRAFEAELAEQMRAAKRTAAGWISSSGW